MTSLEREISRLHDELLESPGNIELKLKYGHACLMRDWRLEALRVYQEVLHDEENAEARLALVKIYEFQGYYPEAYSELRKLFAIDPINLQGHIMLHILKEHEPVPEDLVQRCEFVPSLQYLKEQVSLLLKDRDMLDSQIAEYSALVFGVTEPEPILQYFVMEARKSKERLVRFLAKCDEWSKSAVDSGDFSNYEGYNNIDYSASSEVAEPEAQPLEKADIEPVPVAEENASGAEEISAENPIEEKATDIQNEGSEDAAAVDESPVQIIGDAVQENARPDAEEVTPAAAENETVPASENSEDSENSENFEFSGEQQNAENSASEQENTEQQVQHEEFTADSEEKSPDAAEAPAAEESAADADKDTAKLTALLEPIMNTRGVSSALLYRRNCGILASVGTAIDRVSTFMAISVGMEAWSSLSSDVNCWILEGDGGMVYIQKLTRDNLLIIDSSSTNLGALRISVDKIVPSLEEAL